MIFLGLWVSSRIERGVVQNTANGAALYINSFIEPHAQSLLRGPSLEWHEMFALDLLLKDTPWSPGAQRQDLAAGRKRCLQQRQEPARSQVSTNAPIEGGVGGRVSAAVETDEDAENGTSGPRIQPDRDLLPLIGGSPARVYAVAEFYQTAEELVSELQRSRRQSLYAVALTTLAMLSVLFAIVRRGSQTIVQQKRGCGPS